MKSYEEISAIIETLSNEELEKINNDWFDSLAFGDRNAKRRFLRACKKIGITADKYSMWSND